MKKLIALAVLATSTVTYSAERNIYDIMYLPKAGTTFGFTEAEYEKREIQGKQGVVDTDVTGYTFTQTIGHSFTDRLSVSASLAYGDFDLDNDRGDDTTQIGLGDPTVDARFRVMDETFKWDVLGGVLISRGNTETDSDSDTDNLNGGHAFRLGTQFGQQTETFQWAGTVLYTRNLERTFEVSGRDADIDPNNELLFRADFLNKLAEKSVLRYFASVDFTGMLESDDTAPETVAASETDYNFGAEYQHLFSADLLGRVGVDYTMKNQDSAYRDSDNAWNFIVAANYQF